MFDAFMTLSAWQALQLAHVIALVMGFGAVICAEFLLLRSFLSRRISTEVLDCVGQARHLIVLGFSLLWLTGLASLFYYHFYEPEKLLNEKIYAKMFIVAVLTANAIIMHRSLLPTLRKYAGRHVLANATENEVLLYAICSSVSIVSWCFPMVISLNPELNFKSSAADLLTEYFIAQIIAVCISCTVAIKIRNNSREASLLSYHGKAVANRFN